MTDPKTLRERELASTLTTSTGMVLGVSLFISSFGFRVVLSVQDGEDCYKNEVGPTIDPMEAVESARMIVAHAVHQNEGVPGESRQCGDMMARQILRTMTKEGIISQTPMPKDTDYDVVFKDLFDKELPDYIGGLPLNGVQAAQCPMTRRIVWSVIWGDGEDALGLEVSLPQDVLDMGAREAARTIQGHLQEKVAELKRENPGEYEVECIDATGEEHRFDEGCTYMAQTHFDTELYTVYDRNGERGEFGRFRFKKVEKVRVKVIKNRFKPLEPGDKIRLVGKEPPAFYEHYQQGESP